MTLPSKPRTWAVVLRLHSVGCSNLQMKWRLVCLFVCLVGYDLFVLFCFLTAGMGRLSWPVQRVQVPRTLSSVEARCWQVKVQEAEDPAVLDLELEDRLMSHDGAAPSVVKKLVNQDLGSWEHLGKTSTHLFAFSILPSNRLRAIVFQAWLQDQNHKIIP